jgi:transposase InsO family protein
MAVFDFIEGWYNPHRRHSGLDYESPKSGTRPWPEAQAVHCPRNRGNSSIRCER